MGLDRTSPQWGHEEDGVSHQMVAEKRQEEMPVLQSIVLCSLSFPGVLSQWDGGATHIRNGAFFSVNPLWEHLYRFI